MSLGQTLFNLYNQYMNQIDAKYSVLVVDDEALVRDLIEDMLLETGLFKFIIFASDGQEAWGKLQNQSFDLIILDINMPKKTGHELIELMNLHKKMGEQKILISSGHLDSMGVNLAIKQNVKNFIIKPFSSVSLTDKVFKLLGIERKVAA